MKKNRYLFYLLCALFQSVIHGIVLYFVIYRLIAGGDLLITSLLNVVYIIVGLYFTDKGRKFGLSRRDEIIETYKEMGKIMRTIFAASQVSFRPSMYVFYILILVISQVYVLRPGLIPNHLGDFFRSLEYGLLILLAYDNLKVLLIKEWQWFKENVSPEANDLNK